MLRANHFTGGAITGAVSAIDIALWDIKGKFFNVPVYQLLGGKMRHKARLYGHVKGRTIEKLVEEAVRLKNAGFTALGHLNPLLDEDQDAPYYKPHAAKIEEAIENVRRLREAVGPKVDLCIEIHRRLTPPEAIALARGIEKFTPMFYEDPLRPISTAACLQIAACIPNFAIQEYPSRTPDLDGGDALLGNDLATGLSEQVERFIAIPDGPGIGVELVADVERKFPYRPRPIKMRPHLDGSVVDQ